MAKRKRDNNTKEVQVPGKPSKAVKATTVQEPASFDTDKPAVTLQIVTGSYERVLHGFTAAVFPASFASSDNEGAKDSKFLAQFVDTFLFEAHASAIRCLALSPVPKKDSTEPAKVILASGGTDERINLYSISAAPPAVNEHYPTVPTLAGNKILENPKNRELGSLLHHSAYITALHFPSRSKLLAAAEDNAISVTKTRDFTVVSTIKAPRPKVQGRPSGDTAPPGAAPSGVNDFAVHPSMKLMLTVGKGERCMRLWNLVTGKKAGVLNFGKEVLQSVKEARWSTGEGRKIEWNTKGDEFAVAFEWGCVVFGIDSTPICRLLPSPRSKVHQMKYVALDPAAEDSEELLAISTEDGRVVFYSTKKLRTAADDDESPIPYAEAVAQIGGRAAGFPGRVKDFEILNVGQEAGAKKGDLLVVTANSEGVVRVWMLRTKDLAPNTKETTKATDEKSKEPENLQAGKLLNVYETGNRITCLKAFVMLPSEDPSTLDDSDDLSDEEEEEEEEDDESSEGSDEE
ncbi:putative 60S ribosome biogenesis protein Mak11 [Aspergillus clavatus NRRL 1]|uniref:60S ribosome biogenesis protein Mak11, putative n=1 Tax=Aspergillus clavatus (strain ATCC 1007 / CBS 513.65 / DSM 816 / NCTC 3887 / NRRL 1 / QM 1276 / 107) TaxID=344612 RepID=A1CH67_ASPCL|nr:60S ribosome biogenesis protein Mak11, putative [Aspergillus clavatus NRRL 1]EAW10222.1 60S ribosome biogenesis protein Mak11, putative [Aspergillus clavatus NRRL 1]